MLNKILIAILIFLAVFIISDLITGHSEPVEGFIFAKTYIPERYWYTYEYDDDDNYIRTQHYDPPKYTLSLEFDGGIETIYTNQTVYYYKKVGEMASGYKYLGGITKGVYTTWIEK